MFLNQAVSNSRSSGNSMEASLEASGYLLEIGEQVLAVRQTVLLENDDSDSSFKQWLRNILEFFKGLYRTLQSVIAKVKKGITQRIFTGRLEAGIAAATTKENSEVKISFPRMSVVKNTLDRLERD